MIRIVDLCLNSGSDRIHDLSLNVEDGEIFCLLCKQQSLRQRLFAVLRGFQEPDRGQAVYLGDPAPSGSNFVVVEQVSAGDFDPGATLDAYLRLFRRAARISREAVYEILIKLNVGESLLRRRLREVDAEVFRKLVLAIHLAIPVPNLVFNDLIHGEKKAFELEFSNLLNLRREEGKAILYLTDDIFYALHIADRVAFIKRGHLLPREPIPAGDLEEMDLMKLYRKYLS